MLDLLTSSIHVPADKDEQSKDIAAIEQYKEDLKTYHAWFKSHYSAHYTVLSCMHDDLLGEFERFSTPKDMWARVKIKFGQTSATRLHTLQLKWMQYTIDFGHNISEHLRTISAMVRHLKVLGRDISDEE